ncbi:metal-dependent hydrolase family protein [Sphingobium algorifonticola]|nr:amidohydrolase family protein [Sphingobium algorifonticola]
MALLLQIGLAPRVCAQDVYVHAGRMIDVLAGQMLDDRRITIRAGRIVDVGPWTLPPPGSRVIDWSERTVLPGLIDLHTHIADTGTSSDVALPVKTGPAETALLGARNARLTLKAGFTTVRDVGTYRGLTDVVVRDGIAQGLIPGPRMAVAGAYLTIPGGGGEITGLPAGMAVPPDMRLGVARGAAQVREKAEALFTAGVDHLKIIGTGAVLAIGTEPGTEEMTGEEIAAAVAVARAHDSYVTVHAHGAEGIKTAIRAGARSIEHASLIDDAAITLAKARGVWLVMDIYNGDYIDAVGTQEGWPAEYLRKNRETTQAQRDGFAKAVKAGVRIGFGTDAGVYPHGLNARQFAYMVRHGMTAMQAIQAATSSAAALMGRSDDIGAIAAGRYADLIAVDGDPLVDIRVLEKQPLVMLGGQVIP